VIEFLPQSTFTDTLSPSLAFFPCLIVVAALLTSGCRSFRDSEWCCPLPDLPLTWQVPPVFPRFFKLVFLFTPQLFSASVILLGLSPDTRRFAEKGQYDHPFGVPFSVTGPWPPLDGSLSPTTVLRTFSNSNARESSSLHDVGSYCVPCSPLETY